MSTLDGVRRGYDRWAALYDGEANPMVALEAPTVWDSIGDPGGLDALDLGCGTGRHALWLARRGARVTALDFSDGMLREARAKAGDLGVQFLEHDLHEPLPLPAARFDLAVSGLVLEHLSDLDLFFAETRRVLKPGSRAVVSTLHPVMFLLGSQARFTDPASGERVVPGSVAHTMGDLILAAIRAGFHLEDLQERGADAAFAARFPKAERYLGWPMLAVLRLRS